MQELTLDQNEIEDSGVDELCQHADSHIFGPNLRILVLSDNKITDVGAKRLV